MVNVGKAFAFAVPDYGVIKPHIYN